MSEMRSDTPLFERRAAPGGVLLPFRTLRVLIAPAYTDKLIVSVVTHPLHGHPTLHPRWRQLESPWWPSTHPEDVARYALQVAFLRLSQTPS